MAGGVPGVVSVSDVSYDSDVSGLESAYPGDCPYGAS